MLSLITASHEDILRPEIAMMFLPNGCELSGPAVIINEEARSHWNELQVHFAPDAGSAPASC